MYPPICGSWFAKVALSIVFSAVAMSAIAQTSKQSNAIRSGFITERFEGGSVKIDLGSGKLLNNESSLRREWYVIKDTTAPASFPEGGGLNVVYKTAASKFQYNFDYRIAPNEPITAFEVRVHVFDVFGVQMQTLSATEVTDFTDKKFFSAFWNIFDENNAAQALTSIAYIAQVRTASGKLYQIDRSLVLEEVRKINRTFTGADLDSKKESAYK